MYKLNGKPLRIVMIGLRVKPAKGRLKDLKGIVSLIEELTEQVIRAQEGLTSRGNKPKG